MEKNHCNFDAQNQIVRIMKKIIFVFTLNLLVFSTLSYSQGKNAGSSDQGYEPPFKKGNGIISIASGFGVSYGYYGSYISLPALSVACDFGIIDKAGPGNIGAGGIVGFKWAYSTGKDFEARWMNYIIAARGTYHLTLVKHSKFDPYGGVLVGIRIYDYKDPYFDNYKYNPNKYKRVYPVTGVFVGAKYNFTSFFAGFVEAGYDISLFRVGFNLCF